MCGSYQAVHGICCKTNMRSISTTRSSRVTSSNCASRQLYLTSMGSPCQPKQKTQRRTRASSRFFFGHIAATGQTIVWHAMHRATSAISGWCGWHCVTSTAFLKKMPLADRGVSRRRRIPICGNGVLSNPFRSAWRNQQIGKSMLHADTRSWRMSRCYDLGGREAQSNMGLFTTE